MSETAVMLRFCSKCGAPTKAEHCPHDGAPTFTRHGTGSQALKLTAGEVIDGKYRVAEQLGRGGFGAVYAAEHLTTGQHVAIKVLVVDPDDDDDTMIVRFLQEAQVTARLKHPNTVRVFDFGQTSEGALYMVLELLRGPTLDRVLKDNDKTGDVMTEKAALGLAVPILRSLQEAHDAGLVHRDLKPANVILADAGDDEPVVKVLDFGIARKRGSDLTGSGKALGTPSYMSPEQCRGQQLDGRSDLYPVGLILYRCVAGRLPFQSDNQLALIHAHVNDAPPDLRTVARTPVSDGFVALVHRALAKAPSERFTSAREMRDACQALLGGAWAGTPVRALSVSDGSAAASEEATVALAAATTAPATPNKLRVVVAESSDATRTMEAETSSSVDPAAVGGRRWLWPSIAAVALLAAAVAASLRPGPDVAPAEAAPPAPAAASSAAVTPPAPPSPVVPNPPAVPASAPVAAPPVLPPAAQATEAAAPAPTAAPAARAPRSAPSKSKAGRAGSKDPTHERLELE